MTVHEPLALQSSEDVKRPDLSDWLASWPVVRIELEEWIEKYERQHPGFHRQWTISTLESVDEALRLLAHRMAWLKEH
jgi:hypothetical protein